MEEKLEGLFSQLSLENAVCGISFLESHSQITILKAWRGSEAMLTF